MSRDCVSRDIIRDELIVGQQSASDIRVAQRQQGSQSHRSFASSPQFPRGTSTNDARRASIQRGKQPVGQMTRGGVNIIGTSDPQPPAS